MTHGVWRLRLCLWSHRLRLRILGGKSQLVLDFEGLSVEDLGFSVASLRILEQRQQVFEILTKVDENTAVDIVLDLVGLVRRFEGHTLLLLHTLDTDSVQLCVVDGLSFHTLVIEELEKLLPGDFVLIFVVKFLYKPVD